MHSSDKLHKNIYRLIYLCLPVFTSSLLINLLFIGLNDVKAQELKLTHTIEINKSLAKVKSSTKSKPRIAIFEFDYSTVSYYNYWRRYYWGNGRGVSSILVDKLVKSGNFRVIERTKIEAILKEQNLGKSGRVDQSTAAQIGRLLGAELVVFGSITSANLERNRGGVGGIKLPVFGRVGVNSKKKTANVKLNVRVVNTTTGEIVLSAEGNGTSKQSGGNLRVDRVYVNNNSNKDSQLLTLATSDAINQVAEQINTGVNKGSTSLKTLPSTKALVADVSGNTIIINKGSADGYYQGMKLSIEQVIKIVKDPVTGKELRKMTKKIATVELTEVDSSSSVGKIISGGKLQVGNIAKPIKSDE
ncbi:CsgG/HfaB family protein [Calothrix rhizosoleniae]|uniref:CsgG/HfaB family protein n=1 Tax=Calothrix rhizosoleniae TaxID=888997 RepID=UPI000B4A016B|nr:CsgG/HfaB family protein [Calothrix rhizosoleniae]